MVKTGAKVLKPAVYVPCTVVVLSVSAMLKINNLWATDPAFRSVICNASYFQGNGKWDRRCIWCTVGSCTAEFPHSPPQLNMRDAWEPTVTVQWWAGLLRQSGGELNGLQWEAVGWVSLRLWSFSPGKVVKPGCLLWSNPGPLQPCWCTPVILDFFRINRLDFMSKWQLKQSQTD